VSLAARPCDFRMPGIAIASGRAASAAGATTAATRQKARIQSVALTGGTLSEVLAMGACALQPAQPRRHLGSAARAAAA
jgi:hypothetical protein